MSPTYHRHRGGLDRLDDDMSADGLAMMLSQPSRMMRAVIIILAALLVTAVAWSFYGKSPKIVSAKGTVIPEGEQKQIYSPVKGELVEIFVDEGVPVRKGDVLGKLYSLQAIQFAGRKAQAEEQVRKAERNIGLTPQKRQQLEKSIEVDQERLASARNKLERLEAQGIEKVSQAQRLKLLEAQAKLEKARQQERTAKAAYDQHLRLFSRPDGGGVSQDQLNQKESEWAEKKNDVEIAVYELGGFENKLGEAYDKVRESIQKERETIMGIEKNIGDFELQISDLESKAQDALVQARQNLEVANRVNFEDLDENQNLRLRAPEDGVVVQIGQKQLGAQVDDKRPFVALSPDNARKILQIEINQRNAKGLKVGMPVRMKFETFEYQRYGFVEGRLEYIAEVAYYNRDTKQTTYKARVGLDKDNFDGIPIRYGMVAVAEIVVEQRRIADIALDTIREATPG